MDEHALRASAGGGVKIRFKITKRLLRGIRDDLARPHAFARERVGFASAGLAAAGSDLVVLARGYRPVADEDYLRDFTVGAMMGPDAIRKALQWAMSDCVAVFHVHSHGGYGRPTFSSVDVREQEKFVPNFFQIAPRCAHGALVLSEDSAFGHIWLDGKKPYRAIADFAEIGVPLKSWSGL